MDYKENCCCFTGHRPEKLNISEAEVKKLLFNAVEDAIEQGYTTFITGLAKGFDTWAGETVCELSKSHPAVKLVCALPYPDFAKNAPHLVEKAALVHTVSEKYSVFSYQKRNKWMVDNSSLVIALFNGSKGGTENTLNYAKEKGAEIVFLKKPPLFRQLNLFSKSKKDLP